jgi:hypothetical protein
VNYKLNTKCGVLDAACWMMWHLGEEGRSKDATINCSTPPWKTLRASDLTKGSTQRGYLRHLRHLCNNGLDAAAGFTILSKLDVKEMNRLFLTATIQSVLPRDTTVKGRQRRVSQLTWEYAAHSLLDKTKQTKLDTKNDDNSSRQQYGDGAKEKKRFGLEGRRHILDSIETSRVDFD